MEEYKVSVIIPLYNRENLVSFTLDCLIAQNYSNWECLIIDDGSSDRSLDIVKTYAERDNRFRYTVRTQNPKGPSRCRNIGLSMASGEFVIFLDSDDLLSSDCLLNRVKAAVENPDNDFWVFRTGNFLSRPEVVTSEFTDKLFKLGNEKEILLAFLTIQVPWCVMSPMWRRGILLEINGFDERLIVLEDPHLHIRALIKGVKHKKMLDLPIDNFYRRRKRKEKIEDNYKKKQVRVLFESMDIFVEDILSNRHKLFAEAREALGFGFISFFKQSYHDIEIFAPFGKAIIKRLKKAGCISFIQYIALSITLYFPWVRKVIGLRGLLWRLYSKRSYLKDNR